MPGAEHKDFGKHAAEAKRARNGGRPGRAGANRLLDLLASSPGGCSEALLFAHGFTGAVVTDLLKAGLATTDAKKTRSGAGFPEIRRIKITEAGRRALMWAPSPPLSAGSPRAAQ